MLKLAMVLIGPKLNVKATAKIIREIVTQKPFVIVAAPNGAYSIFCFLL